MLISPNSARTSPAAGATWRDREDGAASGLTSALRDPAVSYPRWRRNVNNILQIILNIIQFNTKSDSEGIRIQIPHDRQEKSSTTFLRKPSEATSACNKPRLGSGHLFDQRIATRRNPRIRGEGWCCPLRMSGDHCPDATGASSFSSKDPR
jgi:hypothetical protein